MLIFYSDIVYKNTKKELSDAKKQRKSFLILNIFSNFAIDLRKNAHFNIDNYNNK